MPNIFDYLDYRRFLYDYYTERKLREPSFSYRIFAEQAGFHSKSFIKHVMEGTKNLTDDSVLKLNRALNLKKKAFSYFNELVHFNHSSTSEEKNLHLSRLHSFNKRNKARLISKSQYEFYSNWYHNTIRELVCLHDFKDDNAKLAAAVSPAITPRQAGQSVALLLRLGLIAKKDGRYIQTDSVISTGDEVKSLVIKNFHAQNLEVSKQALENCDPRKREISSLILGLSEESFAKIKEKILAVENEILEIAGAEKNPSRVYNLNYQLFPTSAELPSLEAK